MTTVCERANEEILTAAWHAMYNMFPHSVYIEVNGARNEMAVQTGSCRPRKARKLTLPSRYAIYQGSLWRGSCMDEVLTRLTIKHPSGHQDKDSVKVYPRNVCNPNMCCCLREADICCLDWLSSRCVIWTGPSVQLSWRQEYNHIVKRLSALSWCASANQGPECCAVKIIRSRVFFTQGYHTRALM